MNIFLHGSIYGFKSDLATPSVAHGSIEFDFSLLPSMSSASRKREVVFGVRDPMTKINVSDVYFSSDSTYTFQYDKQNYQTIISKSDGSVETVPSNSSIITIPFSNFKQENPEITTFTLPNYNYGSYYTYTFTLSDEYISGINVYVKMPDTNTFIEYSIEKVKYLIDPSATVVFFNQTSSDTYTIEFGSGIHGAWLPGAEIKVVLYKTIGVSGNFSQEIKATIESPTQLTMYDTGYDGSITSTTLDPSQYLKVTFAYSEDGVNPLTGDDLRKALVSYIQTRDNFISENDFYNVIEKYTTDFRLLFKKMRVQENTFYLQRALRDEYQIPVRSLNMMPQIFSKSQTINGIHYYTNDTGALTPGLYYYTIYAYDNFGNVINSTEIKATFASEAESGSIHLYWKNIACAKKYVVYGRTADYIHSWETTESNFLDTGDNSNAIISNGLPKVEENPYILFPVFTSDETKFVSPFLYKFNTVYNYYEGWLFYPDLVVNFASIEQNSADEASSITVPSIYINLVYDDINKKTKISLKSYSSIYDWHFTIAIPELNITSTEMTMADESTFTFDYTEDSGYIVTPITITIGGTYGTVKVFTGTTPQINQRYDTSDLIQVPTYDYDGSRYLIDVPVLQYETFNPNKTFYLDKILSFILGFNFEENRINFLFC